MHKSTFITYNYVATYVYVTKPGKTGLTYIHILYSEKYEFEILNAPSFSCGAVQSYQIYYINNVVIYVAIIL